MTKGGKDIDFNQLRPFEFPLPGRSLERDNNFGQAAATYHHQASLHEIDGFDEGDPKKLILEALEPRAFNRTPATRCFCMHPVNGGLCLSTCP